MWNKLTYEKRVYYFLGALLLSLVMGYHLSFKKTAEVYFEYSELINRESGNHSVVDLASLKTEYEQLDSTYQQMQGADYDKILVTELERFLSGTPLSLSNLRHHRQQKDIIDEIEIKGDYKGLVRLIYQLETQFYAGAILSTHFRTEIEKRTKRKELFLTIYVQRNEAHL
ncbi:hypothetical protein [Reichenbachiella ulvae]|uniref:Uncharacterized protein n=1 Tax=Reichenbachiella ulvae TaxID=2980104 RepID=A0ABT3CUZ0_9BACT|nr:hypothetical protein [Reichenbachiella ulvae]MCV9387452.1 hypothetical protein [Reichenbachiella ulvae]